MRGGNRIAVIIPARDEERTIGMVVRDLPDWVDDVVVVDNGSADSTAGIARAHGARVRAEPLIGYGAALDAGVAALRDPEEDGSVRPSPDIVVFLDGDGSDAPEELRLLVDPIVNEGFDLCLGSRVLGRRERWSRTVTQRLNKSLCLMLVNLFWRTDFTDAGPFRALRFAGLRRTLPLRARHAWAMDLQIRAVRAGLRHREVAVTHRRRRAGTSHVFGQWRGARRFLVDAQGTIWRNLGEAISAWVRGLAGRLPRLSRRAF